MSPPWPTETERTPEPAVPEPATPGTAFPEPEPQRHRPADQVPPRAADESPVPAPPQPVPTEEVVAAQAPPDPAPEPEPQLDPALEPAAVRVEKVIEHRRATLLPRSVLGITALVLAFAVGAAFSGAILYSYYEFKKDTTEKRVEGFIEGFGERFDTALATIEAETNNGRAEIQKELEPLRKTRAEGQTLEALVKKVEPSTFFVTTLDEAGQPSVGSAFAVASDSQQTLLVTSYTTVKAATRQPGPPVRVRKGDAEIKSTLWTWDEGKDLALIVLAKGGVPTLSFAPDQLRPGERIFAISALGGAGGSVTQGFVADVSSSGLQHDAAVGQAFQGGPMVNSEGGVLAVASRSYAPLGFTSDQVYFAPFGRAACERVLRCAGGAPGLGDRSTPARR